MINFLNLPKEQDEELLIRWLKEVTKSEGCHINMLLYHFVNDEEILKINQNYLQHDYYTDIITFDYTEGKGLKGEIFISLDTVTSNAKQLAESYEKELQRVIVHGLLHLIGYKDKTDREGAEMREKEDFYLNLRPKKLKNS